MTPESERERPARPGYLVFALVVGWITGLRIAHEGYVVARIVNDPLAGDALTLAPELRDAVVQSVLDNANVALPLAIAQILLGGLLLAVSAVGLFRNRLSVGFFIQVLAANALVTLLGHIFGRPVRDAMIAVLAASPEALGPEFEGVDQDLLISAYGWAFQLGVVLQLLVLALLALALTRPRARRFLAYSPSPPKEG